MVPRNGWRPSSELSEHKGAGDVDCHDIIIEKEAEALILGLDSSG
jgi:hypothetical protein